MHNPKISIITVCFDEEARIEKTILSVSNQTYQHIEYIVIDGASKDTTPQIVAKYKDRIAHFISESDKGIYNAMNKGVALASGDYLLFLNAGDYLSSNEIIQQVVKLGLNSDLVYGDLLTFKEDEWRLLSFPKVVSTMWLIHNYLPHPATFFAKKLFSNAAYYNDSFKIAADYEFFLRVLLKGNATYKHIDLPLTKFDLEGVSASEKYAKLQATERNRSHVLNLSRLQKFWYLSKYGKFIRTRIKLVTYLTSATTRPLRLSYLLILLFLGKIIVRNIRKDKNVTVEEGLRLCLVPEFGEMGGTRVYMEKVMQTLGTQKFKHNFIAVEVNRLTPVINELAQEYGFEIIELAPFSNYMPGLKRLVSLRRMLYETIYLGSKFNDRGVAKVVFSVGEPGNFIYSLFLRLPAIYILHTTPFASSRLLHRLILRSLRSDQTLVVVSEFMKQEVIKRYTVAEERVAVVNNFAPLPIDIDVSHNNQLLKPEKIILTAGHVVDYKNPWRWLEVAAKIAKAHPNVRFVWAGDGPLYEALALAASEYDRIEFKGRLSQLELAGLYKEAYIYFQPSLVESFGISAADALKASVPIIIADRHGLPEVMGDAEVGLLVDPESVDDMVAKITNLLEDSALHQKYAKNARNRYLDKFTYEFWRDQITKLILKHD